MLYNSFISISWIAWSPRNCELAWGFEFSEGEKNPPEIERLSLSLPVLGVSFPWFIVSWILQDLCLYVAVSLLPPCPFEQPRLSAPSPWSCQCRLTQFSLWFLGSFLALGKFLFFFLFENPARHVKGISWFMQYLKLYYSGKVSRLLNP